MIERENLLKEVERQKIEQQKALEVQRRLEQEKVEKEKALAKAAELAKTEVELKKSIANLERDYSSAKNIGSTLEGKNAAKDKEISGLKENLSKVQKNLEDLIKDDTNQKTLVDNLSTERKAYLSK